MFRAISSLRRSTCAPPSRRDFSLGLDPRIWGSGFRVKGRGLRVGGGGLRVQTFGFNFEGLLVREGRRNAALIHGLLLHPLENVPGLNFVKGSHNRSRQNAVLDVLRADSRLCRGYVMKDRGCSSRVTWACIGRAPSPPHAPDPSDPPHDTLPRRKAAVMDDGEGGLCGSLLWGGGWTGH